MPKKQKLPTSPEAAAASASAPELPPAVAKEYGLHHLVQTAGHDKATGKPAEEPEDTPLVSNPKTDAAVDDIVAEEGDIMLAVQDAQAEDEEAGRPQGRLRRFFRAWLGNPKGRWTTLGVLFLLLVAVILLPPARYFALNTLGVRSSVNLTVVDQSTQLPLKNVIVSIGGRSTQTDIKGAARVERVKLGPQKLVVRRVAFATLTQPVTVGWGSNPLGQLSLKATGLQYHITVHDFVSGLPLTGVEATVGNINALSDKKGQIILTMSDHDPKDVTVAVTKAGYRAGQLALKPSSPNAGTLQLVPAAKEFFISNASGKYDLYSMDIDGKDKKTVLAGTGNENATISLAIAPAGEYAAMISTRDGARSKDGYLLRGLTVVAADGTNVLSIEKAEQIKLIDWIGTKIIYQVTVASASAPNSQRNRLISYDYTTNSRVQLAAANQLNGVHSAGGSVYYAIGAGDPSAQAAFMKIKADGTGKQTIWAKEVWTVTRVNRVTFGLQTSDGWYNYSINNGGTPSKDASLPDAESRIFIDNPAGSLSASVDYRDGKGSVRISNLESGKESQAAAIEGATYPLRWLNDSTLVFRVVTNAETADYAVSSAGGKPRKITDLTNAYGFIQQ